MRGMRRGAAQHAGHQWAPEEQLILASLRVDDNRSGFRGVVCRQDTTKHKGTKPFEARVSRESRPVTLGYFTTAEEAALCFAESPEGQEMVAALQEPALQDMTAEQAVLQAEAEKLTLLRSRKSLTGFANVFFNPYNESMPFFAQVRRGGSHSAPVVSHGSFATAEAAALSVARTYEGRTAVLATAAAAVLAKVAVSLDDDVDGDGEEIEEGEGGEGLEGSDEQGEEQAPLLATAVADDTEVDVEEVGAEHVELLQDMTAEQAVLQAEAEKLTLLRSRKSLTGFANVFFNPYNESMPFFAQVRRGGSHSAPVVSRLGSFATAEAAALSVARAVSAAPAPTCVVKPAPPQPTTTAQWLQQYRTLYRPTARETKQQAEMNITSPQSWLDHDITVVEGISFVARHSYRTPSHQHAATALKARPVHKPRWSAAANDIAAASRLGLALDLRGAMKIPRPLLRVVVGSCVGSSTPVGAKTSMHILHVPGASDSFAAANLRLRSRTAKRVPPGVPAPISRRAVLAGSTPTGTHRRQTQPARKRGRAPERSSKARGLTAWLPAHVRDRIETSSGF